MTVCKKLAQMLSFDLFDFRLTEACVKQQRAETCSLTINIAQPVIERI